MVIVKKLNIKEGPAVRSRRQQKVYNRYSAKKQSEKCDFCEFTDDHDQVLRTFKNFWVVANKFPYVTWDGSRTGDHLMVVPKRHIESIGLFDSAEQQEFAKILAEFESKGFSIYARATQNERKSVPHQHTHLIEVGNSINTQIYLRKPHLNIVR